jgi:hypothetical protein
MQRCGFHRKIILQSFDSTLYMSQNTTPKAKITRERVISSGNFSGDKEIINTFLITAAKATPTNIFKLRAEPFMCFISSERSSENA